MKKRLLSVLLVGAMAFSLAACGGGGSDDQAADRLRAAGSGEQGPLPAKQPGLGRLD